MVCKVFYNPSYLKITKYSFIVFCARINNYMFTNYFHLEDVIISFIVTSFSFVELLKIERVFDFVKLLVIYRLQSM